MTTQQPEHPCVKGLYRVETVWLSGYDGKPKRPLVVLALPAYGLTDVPLLARTTQVGEPGVFHAADRRIGCTMNGVFAFRFLRKLDVRHFGFEERADYLGMVDDATFREIMKWWEKR